MAKTRSLTRNQNHDHGHDASSSSSSKKRSKTFDKGDVATWSDLNHDLLLLVMMHLGVVDFLAFGGVCKSWRSLALSNRKWFMASKPPMSIWSNDVGDCYLEDFEERSFKSILPHSAGRICFGLTCGYLIFMGEETPDFWLVNPITRHQLHFPDCPLLVGAREVDIRAILVFSPSIFGWVFVLLHTTSWWSETKLSFYIDGKNGWNHVSSTIPMAILDIHYFKGKIYTLHADCSVGELRLYPNQKSKWTLIETTNVPKPLLSFPEFVSSGEALYVIGYYHTKKVMEVDNGEMKWVSPEMTIEDYAFFVSNHDKSSAAMKLHSWAVPQTRFRSFPHFLDDDKTRKCMFHYNLNAMWYYSHDCLTDNILDE